MSKYRKLMVLVALIAALTMLASLTGVSYAAGGGTTEGCCAGGTQETTCVIGYVINHRAVSYTHLDVYKRQAWLGRSFDGDLMWVYLK